MQRRVSVVLPVRNDADALPQAVRSIAEQQVADIDEILVVVAPSTDRSHQVATELAASDTRIHVLGNPSGRTAEALNLGIARATGDIVVRVDARSLLPVDYVANALESLDVTGAGNVGAVQVPVGDTPAQRAIAAAMSSRIGSGGAKYRHGTELAQVDTAYLGAFRRDALDDVGGYDTQFVRNQDAELNTRLNQAGHQVWLDPRLRVEYRPRASLRALASQYWQYGWWRQRTVRKHRLAAVRQLIVPAMVAATALSAVTVALGFVWAALVPGVYLVTIGIAVVVAEGLTVRERAVMAAALVVMHFSWGTAFMASAAHGLLWRDILGSLE